MVLIWLVCFVSCTAAASSQQYIAVRGRLVCGTTPLSNTTVKLSRRQLIGSSTIAETRTRHDGSFQVEGGLSSLFTMDARLKITHNCKDRWPCKRKVDIKMPRLYIYRGKGPLQWLEAGTLDMAFNYPDEKQFCTRPGVNR
ncbi:unnamed protein product [Cylicocyclus nassatus]|uniref:Transthyretin-like family protein n=1 Tax=Cylicocyclus nassatus TaxID=53992 RepID=A0AA36M5E5_CYLNA|nr:unnamed protein product [Cylicocyclus nassatus]